MAVNRTTREHSYRTAMQKEFDDGGKNTRTARMRLNTYVEQSIRHRSVEPIAANRLAVVRDGARWRVLACKLLTVKALP